jgi:hypothetical protein
MTTYIIIALVSALLAVIATLTVPRIKAGYNKYLTLKNKRLSDMVRTEVEKQLKQIIND